MSDEDQEKFLDDAIKTIKAQAFHIRTSIDKNQLRQCLKESSIMISELKTSLLTPRNYYQLYTLVFDEMQYLEQYFKEEVRRGRRVKDLYDAVQQASGIIPRLYLLITVGSIYVETQQIPATEIIFDLLQMVKGVQNPIRGLFIRYYLLKMIKDKLPDKGNDFEQEKATINDTIKFILQNLEEMNRLWIRLSTGCTGNERLFREKERNELKVLVGENMTRLSSLQGLSIAMYQEEVLPKIISILLESKDQLSQQYLMECVIHAFPDEFNIQCMDLIMDTCTKLQLNVDVKALFIALMEKLAKFVGESRKYDEDTTTVFSSAESIFGLLKNSIDQIIEEGAQGSMDTLKLIELQVAFMKFTIKCCPEKDKLVTVNHILSISVNVLAKNKSDMRVSQDGIKLIGRLLSAPLESELSIFTLPQFPVLMNYLDFSSRTTLSLRIIEAFVNGSCFEKLDTVDKVGIMLDFIRPLLTDSADSVDTDMYQFEYEQQSVAKLIFVIHSIYPFIQLEMLTLLKNIFLKGGELRQKFTLPPLVNAYLTLASQVSYGYEAKLAGEVQKNNRPIRTAFLSTMTIMFENPNDYIKFAQKIYAHINDIISAINLEFPETAFKLFLTAATQVKDTKVEKQGLEEYCYQLVTSALKIFQEGKIEADKKLPLLILLIGTVTSLSILTHDNMNTITSNLQQAAQTLVKRSDQCIAMLSCSDLYFTDLLKDKAKVQECLSKAKRFADFAMTNAQNLNLFILIINKYMYYIEKGEEFMSGDVINDIIETVKNHIITIKTENVNQSFLPEIEKYLEVTIEVIKTRKKAGTHKIYEAILV